MTRTNEHPESGVPDPTQAPVTEVVARVSPAASTVSATDPATCAPGTTTPGAVAPAGAAPANTAPAPATPAAPTASAPGTPAAPKPNRKALGITIGLIAVVGAAGIIGWFAYNGSRHVSTNNARVAANTAAITPEIPGRVLQWNAPVGSTVKAGQVIGQIDTGTVSQSSAANAGALSQVAPLTASRSLIRAPISGTVIQTTALVGQLVAAGQSLAVIADDHSAYISANIKEGQISKIKPGQTAEVKLDSLPGKALHGVVQQVGEATAGSFSILPSGGADSGNFTKVEQVIPVSVYLTDAGNASLRPGASAEVTVNLGDPSSVPVAVQAVKVGALPLNTQLNVVGTLTSGNNVNVTAQVPGTVLSVGPQVGDTVKAGDVVARIDDSTLRAQLAQAEAGLAQAQNGGSAAQANLQLAASTLDRLKAVYAQGGVSRQDVLNAQAQYDNALSASRTAGGSSVQSAQAGIQALRLNIAKTVITSPIDGVVSARNVQPGEVASPAVPLLTIVQDDPSKIVATVPATQASLIKAGDEMQVSFDALPGKSYAARVTSVNPTSVATGDFYPLEAKLEAPDAALRAGMVATAVLDAKVPASTPVLPTSAVTRIGNQNYVYVIKSGHAVRTPVQLGLTGRADGQDEVAVISGLSSGQQVAASSVNALWDGAAVQAK